MSISSEISRLSSAKSAIGLAISGKGVTVPSSTKLDGMAALIAQISARLQNKTVTSNGTVTADSGYDGLGTVTVNVPNKQMCLAYGSAYGTSYVSVSDVTLTVAETGTYTVSWVAWCHNQRSSSPSGKTRLYIDNNASGTEQTTWIGVPYPTGQVATLTNVSLTKGQALRVRVNSGATQPTSAIYVANLCIERTA